MITVDASNIPEDFWQRCKEYADGGSEYLRGWVEALDLDAVLKVEDDFGWDYGYKIKDDMYVLDCRNSGEPSVLDQKLFDELLTLS
jgi:hypothetical protein